MKLVKECKIITGQAAGSTAAHPLWGSHQLLIREVKDERSRDEVPKWLKINYLWELVYGNCSCWNSFEQISLLALTLTRNGNHIQMEAAINDVFAKVLQVAI